MGMAEVNVNWDRAGKLNSIHRTCKKRFETSKPETAHNQHDKRGGKHQPGGTAIITRGDMKQVAPKIRTRANKLCFFLFN